MSGEGDAGRRRQAWAVVAVLTAINLLNYADRYVLAGLQELLKADPSFLGGARDASGHLTDAALGTLTTAFFAVYMVAAPFTGYFGDRVSRTRLIAAGVLLWSAATVASALADGYGQLLAARAFIGIGEAGYATAAPSLLSDFFARDRRGKAIGVFYAAIPLGAAVGYTVGGAVGAAYGWRSAFFVAGLPGLLFGLAALAIREPPRGASESEVEAGRLPGPRATLAALARNRGWLVTTAGMTLMTFAIGGLAAWMPSFLVRFTGLSPSEAGGLFGAFTAVAGLAGTLLGTWLGERAQRRGPGGYLRVSGLSLGLAVPLLLAAALHPGRPATLALTFATLLLALINTGPLNTALVNCLPPTMRAVGVAANIFVIHLLGDALSPILIGLASDASGSLAVGVALNAVPLLAACALLVAAARCSERRPRAVPLT